MNIIELLGWATIVVIIASGALSIIGLAVTAFYHGSRSS
jgi:hypothetical protein